MIVLALIALAFIVAFVFLPIVLKFIILHFIAKDGDTWKDGEERPPLLYNPTIFE